MNTKQLGNFSHGLFKAWQRLEPAAKHNPSLTAIAEATKKLWMETGAVATAAELKVAERKDKGRIEWTVFQPIMLGREPNRYCGGVREIVRTPNRIATIYRWKSDTQHQPAKWEPRKPFWNDLDFRRAMSAKD